MSDLSKQAFPRPAAFSPFSGGERSTEVEGMTLREYYAGLAMQGLLACITDGCDPSVAAVRAVGYADALIDELSKRKG